MTHSIKIITVSGSYSGVGKTRLVTDLLKQLKGWSALKVTVSYKGPCGRGSPCGACDELQDKFSIVTDEDIISENAKDTRKFKDAGAKEVLWLKATPQGLKEGVKEALSKVKKAKGLIIEGTMILKYIKPHLAVFIVGKDRKIKPSAKIAFKKADVILKA